MSTFFHPTLSCPSCGSPFTKPIIKGLHVTRLPEVRAAILRGEFQRYACETCGAAIRVERTDTVYTDFNLGHYIAVDSRHAPDWRASKARHTRVFDEAFTLGPGVAQELAEGMRHRLVFGVLSLREKLLAWDNDLDDLVLEATKADALRARGFSVSEEELRLSVVVPDGPLIFMRLAPPSPAPSGPDGVTLLPAPTLRGHMIVSRGQYRERLRHRREILGELPWLGDDWVIDLLVTHPSRTPVTDDGLQPEI